MFKPKRMRWVGYVARMREKRNAYRSFVGKPEGKRPLGRPRRWWAVNIKMNNRKREWDDFGWIDLIQDREHLAGSCEQGNEPSDSITYRVIVQELSDSQFLKEDLISIRIFCSHEVFLLLHI
jgi:hypothetical protein